MNKESSNSMKSGAPEKMPQVDGFELIENCGPGSESSLWKARQISLGRIVVIKMLAEQSSRDPEDVKQFQFEAKVAANLKHPGIVQVYDFGQARESGRYYFVMEYVEGYSVGDWVRRRGKLSESDALVICNSVADALGYAWSHAKIIHCDIKPDNIMVDGDGTIKVTDLGLARSLGSHQSDEADGDIMGTPNYMSPEQAKGQKHLDYRADIYSMGATLYHVLTGILPFGDSETHEVLKKQIGERLENPGKLVPGISKGVAGLVMKMLEKNPAHRHQGWPEVSKDVVRLQQELSAPGSRHALSEKIDFSSQTMALPGATSAESRTCPYCSKLVSKEAATCPYCKQPLTRKRVSHKPKLKKKAVPAPRAVPKPNAASKPAAVVRPREKKPSGLHFWENIRLVMSLVLIGFLAYYGYQRVVRNRDVLHPLRMRVRMQLIPAVRASVAKLFGRDGVSTPGRSVSPDGRPDQPDMVESPARDLDPELLKILRECEAESPSMGDMVEINMKGQENPVCGALERVGISGVIVAVEHGTIVCPFVMMEEESRLMFFPEERARIIFRQRKAEESASEPE